MATKKKGHLSVSPEWAKHLRPIMKRWFWKSERAAVEPHIQAEQVGQFISCMDELHLCIDGWYSQLPEQTIMLSHQVELNGKHIQADAAINMVTQVVLSKGYQQVSAKQQSFGMRYCFRKC